MVEIILETGLEIASVLLITLIGIGGTWLTIKIGKKQELQNVGAAMEQVIEAARITVGELQQTVVNAMKQKGARLTPEQIKELGYLLIEKTKEKLSAPALTLLEAAKVDVTALIVGAGESWVDMIRGE